MIRGSGENRTLVRTRKPYAFYMLILDFIFVLQQDPSHQLQPYPLNFHHVIEAWHDYFRFNLRRWIFGFGTTSSERRLVSLLPINFSTGLIMENTVFTPHAYVPSRLAVKSSHPQIIDIVIGCKNTNISAINKQSDRKFLIITQ